jgi:hypothetical protein
METIAADGILLGQLIRQSICVSLRRHSHMESCIENSNLRCALRQYGLASLDTCQVCRVVQRSQREALTDYTLYVIVYDNGLAVVLTTVEYAVTNSLDLADIGKNAVILVYESIQDHLNCNLVVRHRIEADKILLTRSLICELTVDTDSLGITLSENIAGGCFKKLELAGRASAVDN